jgi:excisionase family DNA binding protein
VPERLLYPVEEALQLLGLGRSKFYEEVAAGRLRVVKVGRTTRVAAPDLDGYVALLRTEAGEPSQSPIGANATVCQK